MSTPKELRVWEKTDSCGPGTLSAEAGALPGRKRLSSSAGSSRDGAGNLRGPRGPARREVYTIKNEVLGLKLLDFAPPAGLQEGREQPIPMDCDAESRAPVQQVLSQHQTVPHQV